MKEKVCCFFGHRTVYDTPDLRARLYQAVEALILEEGVNTFLFGNLSRFYPICYSVVTALKERYPHIRRIYVRDCYPYMDLDYRNRLLSKYEDTWFFKPTADTEALDWVERNCKMISASSVCVAYYNENLPEHYRDIHYNDTVYHRLTSGTAVAWRYAQKRGKRVINIYPQPEHTD